MVLVQQTLLSSMSRDLVGAFAELTSAMEKESWVRNEWGQPHAMEAVSVSCCGV